MLKIKLARFGKKNQPHFRIIVNEARSKRDGQYVALLGHYAPTATPKILDLDLKAYTEWVTKGAQPTETVAALAKRVESGNPFPAKKARLSKKAVAKAAAEKEAAEAAKAEAKAAKEAAPEVTEEVVETPAEETAPEASETTEAVAESPTEEKAE